MSKRSWREDRSDAAQTCSVFGAGFDHTATVLHGLCTGHQYFSCSFTEQSNEKICRNTM